MKKVTLVMLALTAVMQLPAQEQGRTLSLEEALEMTLSDNPAIRAAEFNRRAAQQERRAAIGLRMPQIGITGSYAYLGKDIEIDLNNMKAPVQNLAGQILQSGMIPSDYIPSISQMLSGAMAASWALPLQDRSLGFVGGDVTVRNIRERGITLAEYDTVIIGSCVYMFKLDKHIKRFLRRNEKTLMGKRLGLYLCCYTTPGTEGYLEHFFSPELLAHAAAKDILGGKMQYAKMSYAYKQLFGALMTSPQYRAQYSEPQLDIARIDAFAAAMRG